MRPHPQHYYLLVDYVSGYDVVLGNVSIHTPGGAAHLVVDPLEPLIYMAGAVEGLLPQDFAGAFGFAAAGRLPYQSRHDVFDGQTFAKVSLTGHLLVQATLPIPELPLSVSGTFVADVDPDDDGRTLFEGEPRDLILAGDAALTVGYDRAGFGLSIDVASASFLYDARVGPVGSFSFGGSTGNRLFAGTPLELLQPTSDHVSVYGHFAGPDDFGLLVRGETRVNGFPVSGAEITLGPTGVRLTGRARFATLGTVQVAGALGADGRFALIGTGDLTAAGFHMAGVQVEISERGAALAGQVTIPGLGHAQLSGHVRADGGFALSGRGDVAAAGLRIAGAQVDLSPAGARISGQVRFAGTSVRVSGEAGASGHFNLTGSVDLNLAVARGRLSLSVSDRGVAAVIRGKACLGPTCVDLAGLEVDSRGRVCPVFPLLGPRCLQLQ
jgi:hypothetical protein